MAAAAGVTGSNGNAFPPSPQPCPEGRIHTHLLLTCKLANEEQALDMYLNNGASKCVCVWKLLSREDVAAVLLLAGDWQSGYKRSCLTYGRVSASRLCCCHGKFTGDWRIICSEVEVAFTCTSPGFLALKLHQYLFFVFIWNGVSYDLTNVRTVFTKH